MGVQIENFSHVQLGRFKDCQRAAFMILEQVHDSLHAGDTERDVARRLRKAFHAQGVHRYFHVPVALFDDRTAYPGDFGAFAALPTERRLEPGMAVILDAAPIFEEYTVDVSLSRPFGQQPLQRQLLLELRPLRELILQRVRAGVSFRQIAREVDERVRAIGCENCHRKHIGAVLGHRVTSVDTGWLSRRRIWGLGVQPVIWFLWNSVSARRRAAGRSPNWNHSRDSDHPPTPGLWAVEPHIARDGVGAHKGPATQRRILYSTLPGPGAPGLPARGDQAAPPFVGFS